MDRRRDLDKWIGGLGVDGQRVSWVWMDRGLLKCGWIEVGTWKSRYEDWVWMDRRQVGCGQIEGGLGVDGQKMDGQKVGWVWIDRRLVGLDGQNNAWIEYEQIEGGLKSGWIENEQEYVS